MKSDRLEYRTFKIEDSQDVFEYASDEQVTKYLTWSTHKTLEQTASVLECFYITNPYCYAIVKDKKCIGSLNITLSENKEATFGIALNRSYWNQGFATEILKAAIKYSFNNLDVEVVKGEYFIGNDASGSVMEKTGMKFVGEAEYLDTGKIVKVYKLSKEDWKSLQQQKFIMQLDKFQFYADNNLSNT